MEQSFNPERRGQERLTDQEYCQQVAETLESVQASLPAQNIKQREAVEAVISSLRTGGSINKTQEECRADFRQITDPKLREIIKEDIFRNNSNHPWITDEVIEEAMRGGADEAKRESA